MPQPHQRITLKALAELLGVSHMTVSLALRNHASISRATKKRVLNLANKLGYRPDPMLRSLVVYRQNMKTRVFQGVLGWLTNFPTASGWRIGQQIGFHIGAVKRARELGYTIEEFWLGEPEVSRNRLTQILRTRGVQGIILAAQPEPRTRIKFNWNEFAAVSLGYSLVEPKLNLVMNHQFRNMVALVQELIRRGFRRIGLAMEASRDERGEHNYLAGYLTGLYGIAGIQEIAPYLPEQMKSVDFLKWYSDHRPEAIVSEGGNASNFCQWLEASQFSVPEDVSIVFANTPYKQRQYSGINEDPELIGATAVDAVVGMLHRGDFGVPLNARHILILGTWQEGKTVGNRQTRPSSTPTLT